MDKNEFQIRIGGMDERVFEAIRVSQSAPKIRELLVEWYEHRAITPRNEKETS